MLNQVVSTLTKKVQTKVTSKSFPKGEMLSYAICGCLSFAFINCATQNDDDRHIKSINKGSKEALLTPPPVPPKPAAKAGEAKTANASVKKGAKAAVVQTPSVASSKESTGKPKLGSEKAPNVSGLTLKLEEPMAPAVKIMVTKAEENLKKGKVMEARFQADRAYRMDLRDPRTSFLLAKVAASEKDYEGAEQWAVRSLENLSDSANKEVVWGLIARVREKRGNKSGMGEALRKRAEYRR